MKYKNFILEKGKIPDHIYTILIKKFGPILKIEKKMEALSNNVYYCETKDKLKFIIKLFRPKYKKFFNRKQELKIYHEKLSFIPNLLEYDLKRFYVFEYIDCLTANDINLQAKNIEDFACNLALLHNLKLGINKRNFYKSTELYLKDCLKKNNDILRLDKDFYNNIFIIKNIISNDLSKFSYDLGLCHNDLNPNNLLIQKSNKKLFFIDFEYSSYNDIYIDLVNAKKCCSNSNYLDFFHYYEKYSGISINEEKFKIYSNLVDYGDMVWYITYNHFELAKNIQNNLINNLSKNKN